MKEGGIFRDGYYEPLDELRAAARDGKDWISELQEREIAATGIKSLKVRYNSVFGYFIEVTKSNLASVPAHYTRKQTTVGGERFITPELKEMEGKNPRRRRAGAQAGVRTFHATAAGNSQSSRRSAADRGGHRDARRARRVRGNRAPFRLLPPGAERPTRIAIRDGRHPVLDQALVEEKFVPNDVELDGDKNRLLIITGPNMAGKSTYIRQVALLVLMAQIGSFVPAASAEIGLVDRIFTRVGASDDLSRGQSTFMVEMNETANILNNATDRSLVILDEIGRGTSTFDGLSIAWSVAEFLHDKIKARTLFATHYHELTELEMTRGGVKNYNVAVREWNDQIIFLRKIVPGGADKSYGIQVARLAGLPPSVIARAKEILGNLGGGGGGGEKGGGGKPPGKNPQRNGEGKRRRTARPHPSRVGGGRKHSLYFGERGRKLICSGGGRGCFFPPPAPGGVRGGGAGRGMGRGTGGATELGGKERRRIGDDVENLGLKQRAVIALRDEVLDELVRESNRLADRGGGRE